MTELVVSDLAASIRWYEAFGFTVEKQDDVNGFVLLNDGRDHRLALKIGTPSPSSVLLHLQVDSLPDGNVKSSAEGYDRVIVEDPDGYRICCFRWRNG